MRNSITNELVDLFSKTLLHVMPYLKRCGEQQGAIESPVWFFEAMPNLTFFVMLQTMDNKDQFVIEIGWSDDGKFPWRPLPSYPPKLEAPKFRLRLARLW